LFGLSGNVSVVTGSGRGLGKVMAQGLAAAGAMVVVCSRSLGEAEQTAQDIVGAGGTAAATRVDISDRKSCGDLIEFAVERFGKIDVLVNNAGVTFISPAEECTESEWDQTLETNLKGYFLCSQLVAPQMMDQGTRGSIINISSIASAIGAHGLMAYSASKGEVNQFTRVMAVEWAPKDIRVNAVAPGYLAHVMTGTDQHTRPEEEQRIIDLTPMARRGRLEEFVGPVVFLASEASSYMTGTVLFVDGGYTAM
jgi:NAD(P)-dependent dehydrogenase (short-subunit alcohol dehydrogenase family)